MLVSSERWTPKHSDLALDNLGENELQLFRYILTRNGHNVALYVGLAKAEGDMKERQFRFPADDWALIDREKGGY